MPYHYIILSDTRDTAVPAHQPHTHEKGYTSRVAARVGVALQGLCDEELRPFCEKVSFYGAKTDYDELMRMRNLDNTVVAAFRNQSVPQIQDVFLHLQDQGAISFFHFADIHSEHKSVVPPVQQTKDLIARANMQQNMMLTADGVITSSEAKVVVAQKYNGNVQYIPDCCDAAHIAVLWDSDFEKPKDEGEAHKILMLGYPFHHIGFYEAAKEVVDYARRTGRRIDLSICTKIPDLSESVSHKPVTGADYYALLKDMSDAGQIRLVDYSVQAAQQLQRETDLVLIPSDPLEGFNAHQRANYPMRGPSRVVDALAHARPVMAIETAPLGNSPAFPPSYQPFIDRGGLMVAPTVTQGIDEFLSMPWFVRMAFVRSGRQIVARSFTPDAVAKAYNKMFLQQLNS